MTPLAAWVIKQPGARMWAANLFGALYFVGFMVFLFLGLALLMRPFAVSL
jgi:hypothetical protein